jgi:hypothetical protein
VIKTQPTLLVSGNRLNRVRTGPKTQPVDSSRVGTREAEQLDQQQRLTRQFAFGFNP